MFLSVLLCATFHVSFSIIDGLVANGNFELGPKPSALKGTVVVGGSHSIPEWEISGFVEYIKSGQKQGDMLLVVPDPCFWLRDFDSLVSFIYEIQVIKNCADNSFFIRTV